MPGLLRTRLGQRSGVVDHARRAARRSVDGQRPEGVDQFRAVRDAVHPAHPHRRRRDPNHEAITAFFVDLDTPGITVRPLRTMHDVDEFCEVYFDDVVVPADRMLGEPGDGWRLAMDLLPYERSTCFWQRIAYLYSRFDALIGEVKGLGRPSDSDMGEAYLALHTLRCRSRATQHRLADGHKLGPDTSIDKVLLAGAEQRSTTPPAICCPAPSNSTTPPGAPSTCTRGRPPSTAAPPRCSATSSPVACWTSGRSDDGRT